MPDNKKNEAHDHYAQRILHPIPEARHLLGGISHSMFYKLVGKGLIHLTKMGRRSFVSDDEIHRVPVRISSHRS